VLDGGVHVCAKAMPMLKRAPRIMTFNDWRRDFLFM